METLSNYDFDIYYYPGKANKLADVLRKKTYDTLAFMRKLLIEFAKEIGELKLIFIHGRITNLKVQLIILNDIIET